MTISTMFNKKIKLWPKTSLSSTDPVTPISPRFGSKLQEPNDLPPFLESELRDLGEI